jgi:2-dehydropantoate 2-reductase
MGSVYAGLLADAGNELHVADLWKEHIDAIRAHGLRVEGASGDRVVKTIHAHTSTREIGVCDLVIIATKASGVGAAAKSASVTINNQTLILTIQNGLGAGERIRESIENDNILLGVAGGFGASIVAPGHAHHNGMELIRVGEMEGGLSDRLEKVADVWRNAGFNVRAFEDINQLIWEKFICNVAFSAPCTVFGYTLGELMQDPHAWKIARTCAAEAYDAGRAANITFSFDDPEDYVTRFGENMPEARPSMLLDHLDRRHSEIDAINGMVPVVAARVGTRAPFNEVISEIVRSREMSF